MKDLFISEKVGFALLLFFVLLVLFAPKLMPYSYDELSGFPLQSPSKKHLLGTNDLGVDNLSSLIYASRASFKVGMSVAFISTSISIFLGVLLAYPVAPWDSISMRFIDAFLAIPPLPLIIVLVSFTGSELYIIILVLSFISSIRGIRVIRSQTISIKHREYVLASRSLGAGRGHILVRHLLPSVAYLGVPKFVITANQAIITESGLAFLGIGDPAQKSWGSIIHYAQSYPDTYFSNTWLYWLLPPIVCLVLLVLSLTLIGNYLERKLRCK